MTKKEFFEKREAIKAEMANLEGEQLAAKERELSSLTDDFNAETAAMTRENVKVTVDNNKVLREAMQKLRSGEAREVTFGTQITDSGAIPLHIHSLIGTLNEGLGLPGAVKIVTGVTGNDVWPVGVSDVDMQEVGENDALSDTDFDFSKITSLVKRIGVSIVVSNKALDEADFDLWGYTTGKIALALRRYFAKKIYSQAVWGAGNVKGPFSGLTPKGTIHLGGTDSAKQILEAVAQFTDKGITPDSGLCLVIDAVTEAALKVEPMVYGEQAGMIIRDGKLLGYDYIVSHYVNTKLNAGGTGIEATADRYLGIGYWNFLAVQQHGKERLSIDNNSKAVAIKNETAFVYNTEVSITDLSIKLNNKQGVVTQAFALYKLDLGDAGSSSN